MRTHFAYLVTLTSHTVRLSLEGATFGFTAYRPLTCTRTQVFVCLANLPDNKKNHSLFNEQTSPKHSINHQFSGNLNANHSLIIIINSSEDYDNF